MSDKFDSLTDSVSTEHEEDREQSESVGSLIQQDRNSRTSLGDVPFNQYTDVDAETERVRSDVAGKVESLDVEADDEATIQSELERLLHQDHFNAYTVEGIETRRRFVQLAGNHPRIGAGYIRELQRIVTSELQHSYADVDQQGGKLSRSLRVQKNAISALVGVGLYDEELSSEVTKPLISVMQFGGFPRIQAHATYGLEQLVAAHEGASVDFNAVCETLRADEDAPRAAAGSLIQTLAERSPSTIQSASAEGSIKFLIDALDDIIPQVRTGAALGLGSLSVESPEYADHIVQTLLEKITEPEPSWDTIRFNDFQALVESFSTVVATSPSARATAVTELCSILTEDPERARPVLEVLGSATAISISNESVIQSLSTYISNAEDSQGIYKAVDLVGELDSTALLQHEIPSLLLEKYIDSTDDIVLSAIIRTLNTIYDKVPSLRFSITDFLIHEFVYTCIRAEPSQFLGKPSKPEVAIINGLGDIGADQKHNRDRICCLLSTVLEAVNRSYPERVQRAAADALTTIAVRSGENLPQIVYSLTAYLQNTNNTASYNVSREHSIDETYHNINVIKSTQTRLKVCESLLTIADTHTKTQHYNVQRVIAAATSDPDLEERIVSRLESSASESIESTSPPSVFPDDFTSKDSQDSSTDSREVYRLLLADDQLEGEQTLLKAIERGNLITRAVSAKRLAAQDSAIEHPKEAVETLTEALETDASVIVRINACKILRRLPMESEFNHESMIRTLTTALEDNRHTVRSQVAQTLGDHLSISPETKSKLVDDAVFDAAVNALVDNMKNDGGSARTSGINAVADIALSNPTVREQTLNELCSTLEALPQEIPTERAEIGAKIRDIGRTDPESRHIVIEHFRKHTTKESIGRNIAAQLESEAILEGNTDVERSDVKLLLSGITDYNVLLEPHIQTNLPTLASRALTQVVTKKPDFVEESQIRAALNSEFVDEAATTLLIHIATNWPSRTTLSPA